MRVGFSCPVDTLSVARAAPSLSFSSSCLYRFKVHEISMSIDLPPLIFFSPTLFFFTPQIFEILISGVSEFLWDEIASSETAGNKMKKLAPRRRAPALSVLWTPPPPSSFLYCSFSCSNQAWNSKHCNSTKLVSHQLISPLLVVYPSFFSTLIPKIAFIWTFWFRQCVPPSKEQTTVMFSGFIT